MEKSEHINELGAAFSKFQGEVIQAPKTKEVKSLGKGPSYKYADLSVILEIALPILSKYGLSVIQLTEGATDKISLQTVLLHSSGQWISCTLVMPLDPPELLSGTDQYGNKYENRRKGLSHPQEVGKYITYGRRYALAAILGISQRDDESEMVQKSDNSSYVTAYKPKPIQHLSHPEQKLIDENGVMDLKRLINGDIPISQYIREKYKISQLEQLTDTQYVQIRDELRIRNPNKHLNPINEEKMEQFSNIEQISNVA